MYESIVKQINEGNILEATKELTNILSQDIFDEEIAVLASTILLSTGNVEQAKKIVERGLRLNYTNHELWLILGQIYEITNINQAYLCYENALHYCDNDEDKEVILSFADMVKRNVAFCVKPASIVILSYNSLEYTKECIESIRATCPENAYEIVIVDNASKDGSVAWLKEQTGIVLKLNEDNVGFPVGCNQGIEISQNNNDIFLLNNDTILPPNAFFWLRMGLYENERVGATGSVSNYVSNFQAVNWNCQSKDEYIQKAIENNLPMYKPYKRKSYLVGFAMMIKRSVLEEVGYLDPIFTPGTYEDNDMGLKIRKAGYDSLLCLNSFIFHYGSGGGSNTAKWNDLYVTNEKKLAKKWGIEPKQAFVLQKGIIDRLNLPTDKKLKILDVGCGLGDTLLAIQDKYENVELYAVEGNKNFWDLIPQNIKLDRCDPLTGELSFEKNDFDVILLDSIFWNNVSQTSLINKYVSYIKDDGVIIIDGEAWRKDELEVDKQEPSIALCVLTHNHPLTIAHVMSRNCLYYYLYNIDVYYFDSSDGAETRSLVENAIGQGYSNIHYVETKGMDLWDKIELLFSEEVFEKEYDFIWPSKDRTFWPKKTFDAIRENIEKNFDLVYLEVRGAKDIPERSMYNNGIALYRDHSLGLTSIDTTIYRRSFTSSRLDALTSALKTITSFPLYYFILNELAKNNDINLCILQGDRIELLNSYTSQSDWQERVMEIWKDYWVLANDLLPECYEPYKAYVIKYVACAPWLIGGIERLYELKKSGVITEEKLDKIKVNWDRVSDIPYDVVKKIVLE